MSYKHLDWALEKHLPSTEKLVLICLAKYANSKTGECWPSTIQIGHLAGLNPQTVSRAITKLRNRQLITTKRRRNRSNLYILVTDGESV